MVSISISVWTLSWILAQVKPVSLHYQNYNYASFLQRTESEWRSLWHTDCHRRCHYQLDQHVDLACRMDIYRIHKRSPEIHEDNGGIFIQKSTSLKFLSPKFGMGVRGKRNILDECCYSTRGCSWEEYAEFCRFSNRLPATSVNSCS